MTDKRPILLFDVMNTVVHEPFFTEVPAFFGLTLDELMAQKHPTSWIEFEHGRLDEQTYLANFFRDGRGVDGAGLRATMSDSYRWLDGMQSLLRELRAAGHEIHALSNYPEWYSLIEERLKLTRYLAWTFVSCRTGLRKPDPEAYLTAARTLGVEPAACLFVDDRQVNVDAARAVDMAALLCTDGPALRNEFVARGLLSA